jgi:formamidopyrimidine-DNA glycosylase
MPELPEVETIRRGLEKLIIKCVVKKVEIKNPKSFIGDPKSLKNAEIIRLRRFGKALILDFSNDFSAMIHLRMTGQLIFQPSVDSKSSENRFAGGHPNDSFLEALPNKQTRVIFELNNGKLFFNDQRKFGFVKVVRAPEIEQDSFIKALGPDTLTANPEIFIKNLEKHKSMNIKAALLDQKIIAGVGNIYADEALFFAKVLPPRKVESLKNSEIKNLLAGAKKAMNASLDSGGSTIQNYRKSDGSKGNYLDLFANVYGRAGEPCKVCKSPIKKTKLAGRGTHFCEVCQK